ncbi:MAG: DUF2752 domain-containing protein [Planctomycetota bacterium]
MSEVPADQSRDGFPFGSKASSLSSNAESVRTIYPQSKAKRDFRLNPNERWQIGLIACLLIGVLSIAAWLEPDPSGMGTHTQLGLPKCTMAAMTGMRCPGCGMTTSWSLIMDGDLETALATNLGGSILCLLSIFSVPTLLGIAIVGRRTPGGWFSKICAAGVFAGTAIALVQWAWRLFVG